MNQIEIIQNVEKLWVSVKNDHTFSDQIIQDIENFLDSRSESLEWIKILGTSLYVEVSRGGYSHGDAHRDGIRSISHFIMGYWDLKAGRIEESNFRIAVALNNMNRYFENK